MIRRLPSNKARDRTKVSTVRRAMYGTSGFRKFRIRIRSGKIKVRVGEKKKEGRGKGVRIAKVANVCVVCGVCEEVGV